MITAVVRCGAGILTAWLFGACGVALIQVQTGAPLTDADLAMNWAKVENQNADDFAEQLVVRGIMPDGAALYAKLTVTNLASADGRADLTVAVTLPDGRQIKCRERKNRDEWTFAKDRFYAEVGQASIELGVGRARVVCKTDDFEIEGDITSTLAPLRPPGGLVSKAAGYYVTTIPIPRGVLALKVKLLSDIPPVEKEPEEKDEGGDKDEGGESKEQGKSPTEAGPGEPGAHEGGEGHADIHGEVGGEAPEAGGEGEDLARDFELEGVAYAEHRASTIAPYALAHAWHGILDIGPDRTVVFSAFEHARPRGEAAPIGAASAPPEIQGWIFAAVDDGFMLYEGALRLWAKDWRSDDQTSYPLPGLVFVSDPARSGFDGVVKLGPLSERRDDLAGLKKIERLVVRRFMKPWTFRFERARFLFRKQPAESTMVEVRGESRYQYQQLNP